MSDDNKPLLDHQILKIVTRKLAEWQAALPEDLREPGTNYVAGGAVASMLIGDEVRDFDVFSTTEARAATLRSHYADNGADVLAITPSAITLKGGIQIITRFSGEPEAILESFDFRHCQVAVASGKVIAPREALRCLLARELAYTGSAYPVASMVRLRKFLARGYRINAGQMVKIALDIAQLDLADDVTLIDQLAGVDLSMFAEVLKASADGKPIRDAIDAIFGAGWVEIDESAEQEDDPW